MEGSGGKHIINTIHKRWIASGLLSAVCIAAAISILFISIWSEISYLSYWWILPLTLIISLALILRSGILRLSLIHVSRLLNQSFPQLEESSALILKPEKSLNVLEKLQVQRVDQELIGLRTPPVIYHRLKYSVLFLSVSILLSLVLAKTNFFKIRSTDAFKEHKKGAESPSVPDKILPEIESVRLSIRPPAYTGRPARQQTQFSAMVENGSDLTWEIETGQGIKSLKFIFNDSQSVRLRPLNKERTKWAFSKIINGTGFYQLSLDGKLSDLYKLETIPDMAAIIKILSPGQYSTIDFGEAQKVSLQVQISDDYGVKDAYISATISSGKGEGVQFKEQRLRFPAAFKGRREYKVQKTLDLSAMGMIPGDELYFYINARDSRQQESRSDIYIVTIQDTAQLMSLDGMLSGVSLVPEYFRSQRQIIIDTEKLLKERNSISAEDFNNRSNNLGFDQKLLRLRYGKFLGEETDEDIGADHQESEHTDGNQAADFGNTEKLMDAYAHKHDIAEDATFFEPELKAQLKATLTEMWKSELRLRTYKPSEALPFEYKALRLLKDLQQKSRVYVAKTAFKPPLIKAEKRLSGELDRIVQPSAERSLSKADGQQNDLKRSTAVLARLKYGESLNAADRILLQNTARKLAKHAATQPSAYLKALSSLRAILNSGTKTKVQLSDINSVETALHKMIGQEIKTPQSKRTGPGSALSQKYFYDLNLKP